MHLEAGKRGLKGLPRDQLPSFTAEVKANWYLILPLVALVYLLFAGFTPLFAGATGVALTIVLILGLAIQGSLSPTALRLLFWIALGLICAISIWFSVAAVALVTLALIIPALASGSGREALIGCRRALADGARQALPVGLACALVGIVIGTMTLTGLGTIVGVAVMAVGQDNLPLGLVLVMLFSLMLGMGVPTIPNYIITSSLAAPILLHLGVPLIVSHMFVFYFGIMADLTPPVALAAFAAAPMAKESGLKIAIQAVRIALPAFIVPYLIVADPVLMLQPVPGLDGFELLAPRRLCDDESDASGGAVGHHRVRLCQWQCELDRTVAGGNRRRTSDLSQYRERCRWICLGRCDICLALFPSPAASAELSHRARPDCGRCKSLRVDSAGLVRRGPLALRCLRGDDRAIGVRCVTRKRHFGPFLQGSDVRILAEGVARPVLENDRP